MALLTTRQKQELILPVLLFFLVGGFIGALWQGHPLAIAALIMLLLIVGVVVFFRVRKKRRIAAAKAERRRLAEAEIEAVNLRVEAALARSAAAREKYRKPRGGSVEKVTVDFKIPVMSNDTLESLTVRVMEQYAERGGTIPVAEAKAMAAKALAEQQAEGQQAAD